MNRLFARKVTYTAPKTGNLDSSQLTRLRSAPKTVDRTDFSPSTPQDVKRALYRVRSSGCVAPKKKSAIKRS